MVLAESEQLTAKKQHEDDFAYLLARSYLRLWQPEDPIPEQGSYWLIGAATWSQYDMKLLDALTKAMATRLLAERIDVFSYDDQEAGNYFLAHYTDGKPLYNTPIMAHWVDGKLIKVEQAGLALRYVVDHFDLPRSIMEHQS